MDARQLRGSARFAAVAAVLGWSALVLQLGLAIDLAIARGAGWFSGMVLFFSYFTILTNILVALALTGAAVRARAGILGFFARPDVNTVVAACIMIVGCVYTLLLRNVWDPQGLARVADLLLHYVMPVAFLTFWWFVVPRARIGVSTLAGAVAYPVGYFIYAMVLARFTGSYPYPFIDVNSLGVAGVLTNAAGMLVVFLLVMLLLVAADWRKTMPLPQVKVRRAFGD